MAVAKKKRAEPSCPLWLATYGDMVTNVLVFFVLLLSMSEIKKDDLFVDFMQAVQEAFGYVGGMEQMPIEDLLDAKNVPLAQFLIVPIDPEKMSKAHDEGVVGKHETVTIIRPGDHFTVGGKIYFPELGATLRDEDRAPLYEYARKLQGHRTQVEVRGHCSPRPVDGSPYADHFELSFARARVVAEVLIEQGIDPRRILVVAAGTNEPVTTQAYTGPQLRENDLVEIIQINKRVEDYVDDQGANGGESGSAASAPTSSPTP